jgi:hypothetical protein
MLDKLISALRKQPLGQGMAQDAANKLASTPSYRQYVIDAQSNGKPAVPLENFLKGER